MRSSCGVAPLTHSIGKYSFGHALSCVGSIIQLIGGQLKRMPSVKSKSLYGRFMSPQRWMHATGQGRTVSFVQSAMGDDDRRNGQRGLERVVLQPTALLEG